ncbi:LOW QUALITY PROTEIN: SIS domain [Dillenia turbinata]|uniref:SIS domain n=1 Tax=Dillenia turbinata TaxID=194707 RepID=A0AAN8Z6W4_9MAGN
MKKVVCRFLSGFIRMVVCVFKFENNNGKQSTGLSRPASVQHALSVLEMEIEQITKGTKVVDNNNNEGKAYKGSCKAKTVSLGGLKDHLKTKRQSRRVMFVGCGTSYNTALAARAIMEELPGILVTMEIASDQLDRQGPIYREDTADFVSQSDTSQALDMLKRIVLYVWASQTLLTDCGVHSNTGCEIGVATTKAYTSKIVVMAKLALAVGDDTISSQQRREAILDGY